MKFAPSHKKHGFSLIEMLTVIAVIGIIAAIAVPTIGKINEASKEAKDRRNAQNLAVVAGSAAVAGLNFVTDDLNESVARIKQGGLVEEGTFAGSYFGVPNISDEDLSGATVYLEIQDGNLLYAGDR